MKSSGFNEIYKTFGYRKFKMSKFEPYDLYADYRDFLTSSRLITFTDLDGTLLAMKPDITLSIVKNNNGGEEKVYYNETVYRPRNHHYREIQQVGVECLGNIDAYCEAEVLTMAVKSLALISGRYVLRISDAGFLADLLAEEGIAGSLAGQVMDLFGTKNMPGLEALIREGRIPAGTGEMLRQLMELYLPLREGTDRLRQFGEAGSLAAAHLREIADILEAFGVLDPVYLDFSLTGGMDYYNGIIFQGAVPEIPYGILFGGRYDKLPRKMGKDVGAIGFAVYLDEIDNYITPPRKFDVDYLVTYDPSEDGMLVRAAEAAGRLREKGFKVRAVREDMAGQMQQKPRSRETLTLEEAVRLLDEMEGRV